MNIKNLLTKEMTVGRYWHIQEMLTGLIREEGGYREGAQLFFYAT